MGTNKRYPHIGGQRADERELRAARKAGPLHTLDAAQLNLFTQPLTIVPDGTKMWGLARLRFRMPRRIDIGGASAHPAFGSGERAAGVADVARARASGGGELSITAVAQASGLDRFTASRHLRVLAEAGLVLVRRERTTVLHALIPERLVHVEDWAYSIALAAEEPAAKTTQPAPL